MYNNQGGVSPSSRAHQDSTMMMSTNPMKQPFPDEVYERKSQNMQMSNMAAIYQQKLPKKGQPGSKNRQKSEYAYNNSQNTSLSKDNQGAYPVSYGAYSQKFVNGGKGNKFVGQR